MAAVPGQIRSLMDALCAANLLLYFAATYIYDFSGIPASDLVVMLGVRTVWGLLMIGLWLAVRRGGRAGWVIAFYVLALLGTLSDQFTMMVIAIVVGYVYLGRRAGHIMAAVAVVGYSLVAIVLPPARLFTLTEEILVELNFLIVVAVPALIGYVLRRHSETLQRLAAANAELAQANADLKVEASLEQELLLAEERARAARELHDGLGHQLTVAGMSLDFAARTLDGHRAEALSEVGAARELVAETLVDIRSWAQALQPAAGQLPGVAGLPELVRGFSASGMAVHLEMPPLPPALNRRQELFVTRFAQEGLTNALKHARADQVGLSVRNEPGELVLQLSNDGQLPVSVDEGFGLRSLRERAAELDGEVTAKITNGRFVLLARLPLAADREGVQVG